MMREMRLMPLSITAILLLGGAFAQSSANRPKGRVLYFLKDNTHRQWCGYGNESQFKAQIQSVGAMVVGRVDYTNGHVSAVHVTQADETGDWAVNDEYSLDDHEKIRTLKRTINIIPEDTSEEQLFLISNGKAIKRRSIYRELRTGKQTQKSVDWFESPPVITDLPAFDFSALVVGKRQAVWSNGEACVPENSK